MPQKIVVSDVDSGHATDIATNILSYCPTAEIEIRIEDLYFSVLYALDNNVDGIVRASTGLDDGRVSGLSPAWNNNIWIIHAHGSNSNTELTEPTYVGEMFVARAPNTSYGDGIEFTVQGSSNQSNATGFLGGMVAEIITQNSWSLSETRQALRETSDGWIDGWNKNVGYGTTDFNSAISNSNSYLLNTAKTFYTSSGNYFYNFSWTSISSSNYNSVVFFDTEPNISSSIDDGRIIYSGTSSNYIYDYNITGSNYDTGSYYVSFFNSGSYSRLESWDTTLFITLQTQTTGSPELTGSEEMLIPIINPGFMTKITGRNKTYFVSTYPGKKITIKNNS